MELGSVGGLAMSCKAFHEEHSPDSAGQAALFVNSIVTVMLAVYTTVHKDV